MTMNRQWIPVGGLLATVAGALFAVAQLSGQAQAPVGDFTNAALAQVKNDQGQVLLEGKFLTPVEEDGRFERRATLASTSGNGQAAGEAELEFAKVGATSQEVELSIWNLAPEGAFTFVIDGTYIASATTDRKGRAEVELDVRMPAARK